MTLEDLQAEIIALGKQGVQDYEIYQHESEEFFDSLFDWYMELDLDTLESKKSNNNNVKSDKEYYFPNYDTLALQLLENNEQFELPDWKELSDTDNYFKFMADKGIRYFWGSQPNIDFQSQIIAAMMAVNPACIPSLSEFWNKEIQVPIVNINGKSRTGKTELGKMFFLPHHRARCKLMCSDDRFATIRENIHYLCYDESKKKLVPSVALFDNFRRQHLENYGSEATYFLKVLKSQAVSRKFSSGSPKDYYCHLLKIFTTVESIADFSVRWEELELRMLPIFSTRVTDYNSIGAFSFLSAKEYYEKLWSEDNYIKFLEVLHEVVKIPTNDFPFPPELQAQTLLTIATGVYVGIWDSISTSLDYFQEYWQFVETRKGEKSQEIILLVDSFLDKHIKYVTDEYGEGKFTKEDLYLYDNECQSSFWSSQLLKKIIETKTIKSLSDKQLQEMGDYIVSKGWIKFTDPLEGIGFRKNWD